MRSEAQAQRRLLIVDDDAEMRDALGLFFSSEGHACELASNALQALQVVERAPFDAVLCDVRMDGMSGLELLDRVRRTHPDLPFVLMTGMSGVRDAVEAMKRGAHQYMTKPCDLDELRDVVADAFLVKSRLVDAAGAPFTRASACPPSFELIGEGAAMRSLSAVIDLVAMSSAPVMIVGETGSGKEVVARAIHARGPRKGKAFVAINTAAVPEALLEAELFGHARGAFTGALQARKGLLVEADGGTLLLDEIGDMPIGLQAKLLRVIQFGEVRPVGSDRAQRVDVRVLASTHRDLPALVRDGRFREDLYFRLNVLPVVVPPLRDRREDIPALAAHLFAEACLRAPGSRVHTLGPDALRVLSEASWPGNVRELANVIERAVVFGTATGLTLAAPTGGLLSASSAVPNPWSFVDEEPWPLRRLNRAYTAWVLEGAGGNKEQAARILGIDLSTLYRWLREPKG